MTRPATFIIAASLCIGAANSPPSHVCFAVRLLQLDRIRIKLDGALLVATSQLACCNLQSETYNPRFCNGVLAQLVERLNGIEEVTGSNPVGSIFFFAYRRSVVNAATVR